MATVLARQAGQFYQRVTARPGEGSYRPPAADDPIIAWAAHRRSGFAGSPLDAIVGTATGRDHHVR